MIPKFQRILVSPGTLLPLMYEGTFEGERWKDGRLVDKYGIRSYPVLDGIPIFVKQTIDEQRIKSYINMCEYHWQMREHRVVRDVSNSYYWNLFTKEATESSDTIIDIASGEEGGFIKGILHVNPEASVLMSDISYAPLRAWQLLFRRERLGQNVCFAVFDASDMPIKSNSVDIITCVLFTNTLECDGRALREIHRVLRPGGKFFLLDWMNTDEDLREISSKLPKSELDKWIEKFPLFGISANMFGDMLRSLGFEIEVFAEVGKRPLIKGRNGFADLAEKYKIEIQATLWAIKAIKQG